MNHVNKFNLLKIFITSIFVFISSAYPQINPNNKKLVKKIVKELQSDKSPIVHKQPHPYGSSENIATFDSILTNQFQMIMDSILIVNNMMGASSAITMVEKGTWFGVYGMSDPQQGIRLRSDMLFDIGSNTKTFIAAQILLLAEQGLLTLDDSLHKWLPSFQNIDSTATIRQLLNHTSGISDFSNENPAWGDSIFANPDRYWSPEKSLTFVLEPNFSPGEDWSYSNTGYILAGMIIKQATGSDKISTILRQQILDPLSLNNTFLDIEENLTGELAKGWIHDDSTGAWFDFSEFPRTAIYSSLWTCGAMVSNAEDMAKWIRALYGGYILNQNSLDEMFSLVPLYTSGILGYGLGTMKRVMLGEELWMHGGDTISYGAQAAYYPPKDACIIVLLNERNYPYTDWYDMVTEQLFKVILKYYRYPHDKVHSYNVIISNSFIKPNQDTLYIGAQVNNPENHRVQVYAEIVSMDNTTIDSTMLYDDGIHNDGQSGDDLFGGYLNPMAVEKTFIVSIKTMDLDSNYSHRLENGARFTSIGPVVFEKYTFQTADTEPNPGDRLYLRLTLKNESLTTTAINVGAELISQDTLVSISGYTRSFGNILPGETKTASVTFKIEISQNCPDSSEIPIAVMIKSNGYLFWTDTLSLIVISRPSTLITEPNSDSPQEFALYNNYPNPFNQGTIIEYQLPIMSHVELGIYNPSGQKVATLISKEQPVGRYKYQWNATNLASGVYFYKITAGDFTQSKKLLLLK